MKKKYLNSRINDNSLANQGSRGAKRREVLNSRINDNSLANQGSRAKREVLTYNSSQTKKLGEKLAQKILKIKSGRKAKILGMVGDLGGGKTTFLQGFAKGLEIKQKILSPTFVILKRFKINHKSHKTVREDFTVFYHIDCYRIKKTKELLDLGFKEIISNPKNIVAIEWADRIQKILPKDALILKFKFIDKNTRKISFS